MELLILVTLLIIAAETTYLVAVRATKQRHTKKQHSPIFVDTSVLIDGRITAIADSGFITSTLYIPRSVVGELQFLADNGDPEKRSRARHGLDIVKELQGNPLVNAEIFSDGDKAEEGVDNRLLKLAKQYKGAVCTIDYNLNKVAQVEGIQVLNVNDLAKTLRMAYLPGETMKLELTQKGNDQHQAVGHLEDGTMVVVEQASSHVGQVVEVEFIRALQTAAGRMMFARLVAAKKQQRQAVPKIAKKPTQRPPKAPEQQKRVTKQETEKPPVKQPRGRQQRNNNRRRSPEDSLVELANQ